MVAALQTGAGHAFAQAALLEKVLLQPAELLVEKVVRLVDEAKGDVGYNFRWTGVGEFAVGLIGYKRLVAEAADIEGFARVFGPDGMVAGAEATLSRPNYARCRRAASKESPPTNPSATSSCTRSGKLFRDVAS